MNLTYDFTGRVVLVTGAAQGIGAAIARTFLDAGAQVVVADRDEDGLRAAWPETPSTMPLAFDVGDAAAVTAAVDEIVTRHGRLDVLVNNAGITRDGVVWKLTDEAWDAVLNVHMRGTFNLTRAVVPVMRAAGWGRIVNVTSYTGLHGNVGQANYAAAKAGIVGFTKTVAKEVARFGITVNAVSPNAMTAMVAAVPPEKLAELTASVPAGRFGDASEMAPAFAFLASEEAGYITGVVLPVDGGLSM